MNFHSRDIAPRIMVVATTDWVFPAQIASSFSEAGCKIATVSVSYSPLRKIQCAEAEFNLPAFRPHIHLNRAMEAWRPQLVVPCDDDAALLLHRTRPLASQEICSVIERSQGSAEGFLVASSKISLMKLAKNLGILVPDSRDIGKGSGALHPQAYPYVIKRDRTFGGQGVTFAACHKEVAEALRTRPRDFVSLVRNISGCIKRKRYWQLRRLIEAGPSEYLGQQAIAGRDANRLVFCSNGRVVAGISVEVEQTKSDHGPAAIVRFSENKQIAEASRLLAEKLQLSGFYGFDFVIEHETEKAYLLEINPRVTQIGHLTTAEDINLIRSTCSCTGLDPLYTMDPILQKYIALFPAGTLMCGDEAISRGQIFFDIPRNEPDLIEDELMKDRSGRLRDVVEKCSEQRGLSGPRRERQPA